MLVCSHLWCIFMSVVLMPYIWKFLLYEYFHGLRWYQSLVWNSLCLQVLTHEEVRQVLADRSHKQAEALYEFEGERRN